MHWRRKWQPTPLFLPGESQGWGAWWAAVYGVAQSWTWLKRLSLASGQQLEIKGLLCKVRIRVKEDGYFANKGPSSQGYGFSSGHVSMWELDYKESWVPKNWCFWTVVLEKTLESPLDCKEIQPVHSKGDQSWVFIAKTDAKAETPILWPPHVKSWLIGEDSDAGRDWGKEEKGMTEDEMARWHHWFDGHEFEWTLGVGDGQGGLACCDSWGRKESDTTEWLNWTERRLALCELKEAPCLSFLVPQLLWFWRIPDLGILSILKFQASIFLYFYCILFLFS